MDRPPMPSKRSTLAARIRWAEAPKGVPQADWDQLAPREKYRLAQVLAVQAPTGSPELLAGIFAQDTAIVMRAREAARALHGALKRLQDVTWCDPRVPNQYQKMKHAVERMRAVRLSSRELARRAKMPHARLMAILYLSRTPSIFEAVSLARAWGTTVEHLAWALAVAFSSRMLEEGVVLATKKRLKNHHQMPRSVASRLPHPAPMPAGSNLPDLVRFYVENEQELRPLVRVPARWIGKRGVKATPAASPEDPPPAA
jgi:hypothetical protein